MAGDAELGVVHALAHRVAAVDVLPVLHRQQVGLGLAAAERPFVVVAAAKALGVVDLGAGAYTRPLPSST